MADYYSILKKTIASLPENNGGARRSVYSRARNAIVSQLKAYEPPLSPSEITAEQLRLEEAIRKVEAEAARESLGLGPATKAPPVAPSPPAAAESAPAPAPAAPAPAAAAPAAQTPPAATPEPETPVAKAPEPQQPVSPLKETVAEADELGAASRKAVETAKEAVTPPGEDAPARRQEPAFAASEPAADNGIFEQDGRERKEPRVDSPAPAGAEAKSGPAKSARKARTEGRVSDRLRSGAGGFSMASLGLVAVLILIALGIGGILYSQRDMISEMVAGGPEDTGETASSVQQADTKAPTGSSGEDTAGEKKPGKISDRLLDNNGEPAAAPDARAVTTTTITPGAPEPRTVQPATPAPTAPAPVAATPEPAAPATPAASVPAPTTPAIVSSQNPAPAPAAPADPQQETTVAAVDQTEQAPPAASSDSIAVAQRSILYEEGAGAAGAGTASQGEVVWSVEEEADLEGRKRTVLTAAIRIPEREMTVDIRIKPNDDASLPASHLVEIKYGLPEGFSGGDVQNVPGLVMKPTEQARGDALLGASVKVSPGYFWIALSSIQSEQERNIGLLRERGWIDIPMLYDNGRRGILTLEKGRGGNKAVEQAVQAWQAG
jgi:outer membrane biosynthesis protein TonB